VNPYQAIADRSATGSYTHGERASRNSWVSCGPKIAAYRQVGNVLPPPVAAALEAAIAIAFGHAFYHRPPKPGQAITHHLVHSGPVGDFRRPVLQRPTDYGDLG
jgi:hypothetical protein